MHINCMLVSQKCLLAALHGGKCFNLCTGSIKRMYGYNLVHSSIVAEDTQHVKNHELIVMQPGTMIQGMQPCKLSTCQYVQQVDELRGTPLTVGTLEEIIDEK